MGKKVKVVTAAQAIEKYKKQKEELIRIQKALEERNIQIKELNKKVAQLLLLNANLRKQNKSLRKICNRIWVFDYLDGE